MSQFNYNSVNVFSALKQSSSKVKPRQKAKPSKVLKVKAGKIKKSTSPKKALVKKVKKVAARQKSQQSITIRKTITTTVTAKNSASASRSRSKTAVRKKSTKAHGKK